MNLFDKIKKVYKKEEKITLSLNSNDLKTLCCIYKKIIDNNKDLLKNQYPLIFKNSNSQKIKFLFFNDDNNTESSSYVKLEIYKEINAICKFNNKSNITYYKDSIGNEEYYEYDENNELKKCIINGICNTFYTEGSQYIRKEVYVNDYNILNTNDVKILQKIQDDFCNDRKTLSSVKKSTLDKKMENYNNRNKYQLRSDLIHDIENKYVSRSNKFCNDVYGYLERKFGFRFSQNIKPCSLVEKVDCNDIIQDALNQLDINNNVNYIRYKESLMKLYISNNTKSFDILGDRLNFIWLFNKEKILDNNISDGSSKKLSKEFSSYIERIYRALSCYYGFKYSEKELQVIFNDVAKYYNENDKNKIYKYRLFHLNKDLDCLVFGNNNTIELRFIDFEKANNFLKYIKNRTFKGEIII